MRASVASVASVAVAMAVLAACGSDPAERTLDECLGTWVIEEQIGASTCCSQGSCTPGAPADIARETLRLATGSRQLVAVLGNRTPTEAHLHLDAGACVFTGTFAVPYGSGTITQRLELALRTDGRIVGTGALLTSSGDGTTTPVGCSSEIFVTGGHLE